MGLPARVGSKSFSQDAWKLLQSTSAMTAISDPDPLELADHHTPDHQLGPVVQVDGGIGWILGDQGNTTTTTEKTLHQALTIEEGHHHVPVPRRDAAIHHQDIPVEDLSALHGVALHPEEKGADRVSDEVFVDVEATVCIVLGRRRETSRDRSKPEWKSTFQCIETGQPAVGEVCRPGEMVGVHLTVERQILQTYTEIDRPSEALRLLHVRKLPPLKP